MNFSIHKRLEGGGVAGSGGSGSTAVSITVIICSSRSKQWKHDACTPLCRRIPKCAKASAVYVDVCILQVPSVKEGVLASRICM